MKDAIQRAKELVKHNKIIKISDRMWEINKHVLKINIKQGRKVLTCDCPNSGRFNHENLCYHKIGVILLEADNEFYKKIDKLISDYKQIENIHMKISPYSMINDLENLRRIK